MEHIAQANWKNEEDCTTEKKNTIEQILTPFTAQLIKTKSKTYNTNYYGSRFSWYQFVLCSRAPAISSDLPQFLSCFMHMQLVCWNYCNLCRQAESFGNAPTGFTLIVHPIYTLFRLFFWYQWKCFEEIQTSKKWFNILWLVTN